MADAIRLRLAPAAGDSNGPPTSTPNTAHAASAPPSTAPDDTAPRDARSGTRPVAGTDAVDSILREYLRKPTTPSMDAVRIPVVSHTPSPRRDVGVPTPPPDRPHASSKLVSADSVAPEPHEDDRPTGRFFMASVTSDPSEHVRDRGVLVRLDGDASGELLSLTREGVLVGRSSSAEVHIPEPSVSREHARIVFESGAYYVVDGGSQNGTLLAGRRVTRAELRDGDLLQFGQRATYRFQLMDQTQERVMRRLYDSSMRDSLTGADNRRHMDTRLEGEIAFAQRHKRPLSIVLLDIDFFKAVNDRHGHPAGDEVLKSVASIIRGQLRTEDAFARYGGEEFVIVLRDTGLTEAALVADRVRERIAHSAIDVGDVSMSVTVSAGCASLACCLGASTEELVGVADRRLYRAKRTGRNRVVSKDD